MAENYKHSGYRVPIVSASGAIASGALVVQEKFIGVALGDIASGAAGWIQRTGVWRIAVPAGVLRGDALYGNTGGADSVALTLTETSTTNTFIGTAITDRDAGGFSDVLLNGLGVCDPADV